MAKNILYLERNPSHFNATSIRYDLKLPCILALSSKNPFGFSIQNSARISDFPHSIYVHIATNVNIEDDSGPGSWLLRNFLKSRIYCA